MKELSLKSGTPINELLNKSSTDIIALIRKVNSQTQPGEDKRHFSTAQNGIMNQYQPQKKNTSIKEQSTLIESFCDSLPTADQLKTRGYAKSNTRTIYPSINQELPLQLEKFEDQMSDLPTSLPVNKYRGEYVRPNRLDYTQHQVATANEEIITMVNFTQGKPQLQLESKLNIGKPCEYSSNYKWQNPAFRLNPNTIFCSDYYDRIARYTQVVDRHLICGFAEKSTSDKMTALLEVNTSQSHQEFTIVLNTNSRSYSIPKEVLIQTLLTHLDEEQHLKAMLNKPSAIICGKDNAAPKMQPVRKIPAQNQHAQFLEETLFYINLKREKIGDRPLTEQQLFQMSIDDINHYLFQSESRKGKFDHKTFFEALTHAKKFREYERKPKLTAKLEDDTVVEVSMNDSVDIPSQALLILSNESNITETNRPVNLALGYQSLQAIIDKSYSGKPQNIILSNLAYTQASSTQSMIHFHLVPTTNSEGQFIIPYIDSKHNEFEEFKESSIPGVNIAFLNKTAQQDYFNLVKLKFNLCDGNNEISTLFNKIDQKLQRWELETGCDMTWVAKFDPNNKSVIICIELRSGINQFTQNQIDKLRDRDLWNKIGFTEVMGKKYSMMSQRDIDEASCIYDKEEHTTLKNKMLQTSLYCLQVSPDGTKKNFYNFFDHQTSSKKTLSQKQKHILHLARILQVYRAEQYTKTCAALYQLRDNEIALFKNLLEPCDKNNTNNYLNSHP